MSILSEVGERSAIQRIVAQFNFERYPVVGIGDDAAVVRSEDVDSDIVLKSDPVISGVHFTPHAKKFLIGRKAVGRVLSDLAAMGAEPLWLLINLVAPPNTHVEDLEELYRGAGDLVRQCGAAIIGGDLTEGPLLELHVFGMGRLPRGTAVCRSAARPGDAIYVTGALGGSIKGHHLNFRPKVKEGHWLRASGFVRGMIDISDGLVTDLWQIAEMSCVGAVILEDKVPITQDALAMDDHFPPLHHALYDGEDYELLFTVNGSDHLAFESRWRANFPEPCYLIGKINADVGVVTMDNARGKRTALSRKGFQHFATQTDP